MRMYDLIEKKKMGQVLTKEELSFMIKGYVSGEIPDYQMSAFLMAVYFQGMSDEELTNFTKEMTRSGEIVDLSLIEGIKVDKHSTGGVGDKTTLIIGPIVASLGVKVAKMSGRGLGFTGGTIDKLESIPQFRTSIEKNEFFTIVNKIGLSVIGQSQNLAPADKKLYALRDVTATVNSIPLIAASVMSKKLAAGSDCILLDVTAGSGAFMKSVEEAKILAKKMVAIGEGAGKKTVALITNMDTPLGKSIGNILEVKEVIETLQGNGPSDLTTVCLNLAGNMLFLAEKGSLEECLEMAKESLENGTAYEKFIEMVEAQGGDRSVVTNPDNFAKATYEYHLVARESGFITHMDTEQCGIASMVLGAGRLTKESQLDYTAGIMLEKKTGDQVFVGDTLAKLYSNSANVFEEASSLLLNAYMIRDKRPEEEILILGRVTKDD